MLTPDSVLGGAAGCGGWGTLGGKRGVVGVEGTCRLGWMFLFFCFRVYWDRRRPGSHVFSLCFVLHSTCTYNHTNASFLAETFVARENALEIYINIQTIQSVTLCQCHIRYANLFFQSTQPHLQHHTPAPFGRTPLPPPSSTPNPTRMDEPTHSPSAKSLQHSTNLHP